MSHEIDETTGKPAFAFDAKEGGAWHGLGQPIPEEIAKDPRAIAELVGAAYKVEKEQSYIIRNGKQVAIPNRVALVRDDTDEILEVLSDNRYKVVQPVEYFEAFRDSLAKNDLRISSAGVLKGGRIVFVNAKLDDAFASNVMGVDKLVRYLCMGGGYDGTLSSFGYVSDFRTVCWNTLSANLSQAKGGRSLFTVPHSSIFDGQLLGAALGLLGAELKVRAEVFNRLAGRKVLKGEVTKYFANLVGIKTADIAEFDTLSKQKQAKLNALAEAYQNGPGAGLVTANGTLWGALNAVTHYVDHLSGTRDTTEDGADRSRFASAQFGTGAELKAKALKLAMSMAGIGEEVLLAA